MNHKTAFRGVTEGSFVCVGIVEKNVSPFSLREVKKCAWIKLFSARRYDMMCEEINIEILIMQKMRRGIYGYY